MTPPREDLVERMLQAFAESGVEADVESDIADRPILIHAHHSSTSIELRVFIWNATPGGPPGVRAASEFRVQTTRPGDVPFLVTGSRQTLLVGYHEDLDV